jgi:hypothetical protein
MINLKYKVVSASVAVSRKGDIDSSRKGDIDSSRKGDIDSSRKGDIKNQLKGNVDFNYMSSDWNVKSENDGGWRRQNCDWRVSYMKGFPRALGAGTHGTRAEVAVVSHSSFLEKLIGGEYFPC